MGAGAFYFWIQKFLQNRSMQHEVDGIKRIKGKIFIVF